MKRLELSKLFANISEFEGKNVTVCGWVKSIRASKSLAFVMINDGSAHKSVQVVVGEDTQNFAEISKQNVGAALSVTGKVIATPTAKQPFEISAIEVIVEGGSTADYPLQKKQHSLEFLRSINHLRMRTNTLSAVFRVRSVCAAAIHRFFHENGFYYVHTPIITASDCEGAGEMFAVTTLDMANPPKSADGSIDFTEDFFGKRSALTVSGQLEAECMAMALGKVYTFGPTFRAEKSYTPRHAAEFWMIEPEMAFADLSDDMELAENLLKYVIRAVLSECPDEMTFFNDFYDKELVARLDSVAGSQFAHVTYTEAIELLENAVKNSGVNFEYPVSWGCDLQTEHERYLTEKCFGKPLFVTDYPKDIKAFYMRMNDDGKTVAAMDLLVPAVGELVGGSQREERTDRLISRMEEMGLSTDEYDWYLDLRRFGGAKHCGFGLGFERLVMYITAMGNIRDVIPFPRTTK